jgi:hypothetical protein
MQAEKGRYRDRWTCKQVLTRGREGERESGEGREKRERKRERERECV